MNKYQKVITRIIGLVLIVTVSGIAMFQYKRTPAETAFLRGKKIARHNGCFGCHGEGGLGFYENGPNTENIPSWNGGTAMMYIKSDTEIKEWIIEGHPKRLRGRKRAANQILSMPAYRGRFTPEQLADLIEYFKTVAEILPLPQDSASAKGYQLASQFACFACHGPGGRGGVQNPGSFSGFIPPWEGSDFRELARNDAELVEWIKTGTNTRLRHNPIAKYFLRHQWLSMPAYEDKLSLEEIKKIITYIRFLSRKEKQQ